MSRPKTGHMEFEGDWTGVFIRGDNAHLFAMALSRLIEGHTDPLLTVLPAQGLLRLLQGSDERTGPEAQKMKPYDECKREESK